MGPCKYWTLIILLFLLPESQGHRDFQLKESFLKPHPSPNSKVPKAQRLTAKKMAPSSVCPSTGAKLTTTYSGSQPAHSCKYSRLLNPSLKEIPFPPPKHICIHQTLMLGVPLGGIHQETQANNHFDLTCLVCYPRGSRQRSRSLDKILQGRLRQKDCLNPV